MSLALPDSLQPKSLSREGAEKLVIEWKDGHRSVYRWQYLRDKCPCAACREEKLKPTDPFHILKPSELVPLTPVAMAPVGHYAYRIAWSDGHDSGIYTLEHLRELCQCDECKQRTAAERK
jgi:DUF971 family protein